jgi:hypothetical protein
MNALSASPTMIGDLYRVADLALFPAGNGLVLVYSKQNQVARFLRTEIVDLLTQCREFKTIDDHLQRYCSGRQMNAAMMRTMRRELIHLIQSGYLISQRTFREAPGKSGEHLSASQIASIGFPTCDRVETLQRLQNREEAHPAFWVQDVKSYISQLRQSALTPVDHLYSLNGGRETTQHLLVQFGEVLKWWPTIIETAGRLRMEGYRLAQPV